MDDGALKGYTGVITGAAGPLGSALTSVASSAGARVFALDLIEERLLGDVKWPLDHGGEVTYIQCDLTSVGDLERSLLTIADSCSSRGVDFLVNNAAYTGTAGIAGYATVFEEQTDEAFDAAVELNLSVPFRLIRRALPLLRESGRGSIVNVASIYGLVGPDLGLYEGTSMGNPAAYAASKGGLVQLTRYLATVLAPHVRVNCIAPGGIERGQPAEFVRRYEQRTPLGRMAHEEDMAGALLWLLGAGSSYVTGQVIAIDGGWTAW